MRACGVQVCHDAHAPGSAPAPEARRGSSSSMARPVGESALGASLQEALTEPFVRPPVLPAPRRRRPAWPGRVSNAVDAPIWLEMAAANGAPLDSGAAVDLIIGARCTRS